MSIIVTRQPEKFQDMGRPVVVEAYSTRTNETNYRMVAEVQVGCKDDYKPAQAQFYFRTSEAQNGQVDDWLVTRANWGGNPIWDVTLADQIPANNEDGIPALIEKINEQGYARVVHHFEPITDLWAIVIEYIGGTGAANNNGSMFIDWEYYGNNLAPSLPWLNEYIPMTGGEGLQTWSTKAKKVQLTPDAQGVYRFNVQDILRSCVSKNWYWGREYEDAQGNEVVESAIISPNPDSVIEYRVALFGEADDSNGDRVTIERSYTDCRKMVNAVLTPNKVEQSMVPYLMGQQPHMPGCMMPGFVCFDVWEALSPRNFELSVSGHVIGVVKPKEDHSTDPEQLTGGSSQTYEIQLPELFMQQVEAAINAGGIFTVDSWTLVTDNLDTTPPEDQYLQTIGNTVIKRVGEMCIRPVDYNGETDNGETVTLDWSWNYVNVGQGYFEQATLTGPALTIDGASGYIDCSEKLTGKFLTNAPDPIQIRQCDTYQLAFLTLEKNVVAKVRETDGDGSVEGVRTLEIAPQLKCVDAMPVYAPGTFTLWVLDTDGTETPYNGFPYDYAGVALYKNTTQLLYDIPISDEVIEDVDSMYEEQFGTFGVVPTLTSEIIVLSTENIENSPEPIPGTNFNITHKVVIRLAGSLSTGAADNNVTFQQQFSWDDTPPQGYLNSGNMTGGSNGAVSVTTDWGQQFTAVCIEGEGATQPIEFPDNITDIHSVKIGIVLISPLACSPDGEPTSIDDVPEPAFRVRAELSDNTSTELMIGVAQVYNQTFEVVVPENTESITIENLSCSKIGLTESKVCYFESDKIDCRGVVTLWDEVDTNTAKLEVWLETPDGTTISEVREFQRQKGECSGLCRLSWLNPLGGYDAYTFEARSKVDGKQKRTQTNSPFDPELQPHGNKPVSKNPHRGRAVNRINADRVQTCTTKFETDEVGEWLAEIAESSDVYLITEKGERCPVMITSKKTSVSDTNNLKQISISFVPSIETVTNG